MRKIKKIILIVILSLVFSGCSLASKEILDKSKEKEIEKKQKNIIQNEEKEKRIIVKDEKFEEMDVENWKTYRNNDYGFEIKYPKQWMVNEVTKKEEKKIGRIVFFETPDAKKLINEKKLHPDERFSLLISYWEDIDSDYADGGGRIEEKEHDSLEDFFNNNESLKQKIGEIKIGDQKAYEVIIGGMGSSYGIMLENNGIFELSFGRIWDKSRLTPVEKKVIKSFKFIK